MSDGLQQLWGLESLGNRTAGSQQAEQFHQAFSHVMAQANQALQSTAVQAGHAEHAALDIQRTRLYDVYQMASRKIDAADPARADRDISRVLAAAEAFRDRATALAGQSGSLSQEWSQHETDFDDLVDQVGELEAAEHPKAPAMRQLVDAIRTRSNDHDYRNSLNALRQARPKVEAECQQHQESDRAGNGAPAAEREPTVRASERTEFAETQVESQAPVVEQVDSVSEAPRGAQTPPDAITAAVDQSSKATGEDLPAARSQQPESVRSSSGDARETQESEEIDESAGYVGSSAVAPSSRSQSVSRDTATADSAVTQTSREPQSAESIQPHEATRAETPSAEAPTDGVGSGFFSVKDNATGAVVEGARISIGDENLVTNALGAEAWALPPGRTNYHVNADGYQPASGAVNVVANGDVVVDVGLMPQAEVVTSEEESQREVCEMPLPNSATAETQSSAESGQSLPETQREPVASAAGGNPPHDASHTSRPLSPEERDQMVCELDRIETDLTRLQSEHDFFR